MERIVIARGRKHISDHDSHTSFLIPLRGTGEREGALVASVLAVWFCRDWAWAWLLWIWVQLSICVAGGPVSCSGSVNTSGGGEGVARVEGHYCMSLWQRL